MAFIASETLVEALDSIRSLVVVEEAVFLEVVNVKVGVFSVAVIKVTVLEIVNGKVAPVLEGVDVTVAVLEVVSFTVAVLVVVVVKVVLLLEA